MITEVKIYTLGYLRTGNIPVFIATEATSRANAIQILYNHETLFSKLIEKFRARPEQDLRDLISECKRSYESEVVSTTIPITKVKRSKPERIIIITPQVFYGSAAYSRFPRTNQNN